MIVGKDIYENQVIGSFMALLWREHGVRHGRAPFEPFGLQLLQQTPHEQAYGDVVISQAKLIRLIEFKRRRSKSKKERAKLKNLLPALAGAENEPLIAISREIHWYVETDFTRRPNSIVVPYLDLKNPSGDRDLELFVREIGDAMDGPGMTEQDLESARLYMQALASLVPDDAVEGDSGGLIVATGAGGKTTLYPIRDVRELIMTPQQVFREHELRMTQTSKLDRPEDSPQLRLERGMRRRGPSLGL